MWKDITRHTRHYTPLIGVLAVGVLGFFVFSYDKAFQIWLITGMALSYVVWGLIHHKLHGDLNLSVIIEYVAIATLGLVILYSLIINA